MAEGTDESKVWFQYERTLSTAPYESIKIQCGGSAPLEDGESHAKALARLKVEVKGQLQEEVNAVHLHLAKKRGDTDERTFKP